MPEAILTDEQCKEIEEYFESNRYSRNDDVYVNDYNNSVLSFEEIKHLFDQWSPLNKLKFYHNLLSNRQDLEKICEFHKHYGLLMVDYLNQTRAYRISMSDPKTFTGFDVD